MLELVSVGYTIQQTTTLSTKTKRRGYLAYYWAFSSSQACSGFFPNHSVQINTRCFIIFLKQVKSATIKTTWLFVQNDGIDSRFLQLAPCDR